MGKSQKTTKYFFSALFALVVIAIGFGYYNIMINQNFKIFTNEKDIPSFWSLFNLGS